MHCVILPMDACHLLLGRPWQYDRDATHRGNFNTYSFIFEDHTITLLPSKEMSTSMGSPILAATKQAPTASPKSLLIFPNSAFE